MVAVCFGGCLLCLQLDAVICGIEDAACRGITTFFLIDGGLHPAVDGQSLDEDEDEDYCRNLWTLCF